MTWARSSGVCRSITKIAVAGILVGIPVAAVNIPACAAPGIANAPAVLPAPPPADPPTYAPAPPAPPHHQVGEELNAVEDWWMPGDAGGGGGGGG
jgi:hypothetical protein